MRAQVRSVARRGVHAGQRTIHGARRTARKGRVATRRSRFLARAAVSRSRSATRRLGNRSLHGARRGRSRAVRLRRRSRRRFNRLRNVARRIRAEIRDRLFPRRIGRLHHYPPQPLKLPVSYLRPPELAAPPTVSIVTPSYNQAEFLERTIQSVVGQDYPALEYVVQDGGSDDETVEILERHAPRLHRWESAPDRGQAHAINLGFEGTTGEIMAYLNSDDVLLPGAIAYAADYLRRHPDVELVYGHRILIDERDREVGRWIMPPHDDEVLSWADFVPQETMFWRRELWERSGAAMVEDWYLILDWDLLARFRAAGAKMVRLNRFMGGFRVHPQQHTQAYEGGREEMQRMRARELGYEPTPLEVRRGIRPYMWRHHLIQKAHEAGLLRF